MITTPQASELCSQRMNDDGVPVGPHIWICEVDFNEFPPEFRENALRLPVRHGCRACGMNTLRVASPPDRLGI